MSTDIAQIWDAIDPTNNIGNWRDPTFSDAEYLLSREGFEGFFPERYSGIYSEDVMRAMLGDLANEDNYRVINSPFNIPDIDTLSQPEVDEALTPVVEKAVRHPKNSRILLADFNGAAIAIRHSGVDAIIVKDCEKPDDMLTESCEGQEIEFLIHDTIRSDNPERFMIGTAVQAEIEHLQHVFTYATGKTPTHHEAIIQATGPTVENPLQGEWHFDRETIQGDLMMKAILDGRIIPEQKYLLIKTARGQDTQYTPEVLERETVLGWNAGGVNHDEIAKEINAEDVIYNGALLTKVSLAGELLAKIQPHNDFVHRSPTVMRGFGRGAFAFGG